MCVLCHEYITKNIAMDGEGVVQGQEATDIIEGQPVPPSGAQGNPQGPRRNSALSVLDLRYVADDAAQEAIEEDAALTSESFRLSDPRMLRQLMESIVRPEGGVALGTRVHHGGAFHNCFTGAELVDWIRKLDCFVTTERSAKVLGQALLSNGYINSYTDEADKDGVFECDDTPYRPTNLDQARSPVSPGSSLPPLVQGSAVNSEGDAGEGGLSPTTDDEVDSSHFPDWLQEVESHSGQNTLERKTKVRDKSKPRDRSVSRHRKDGKDGQAAVMSDMGKLVTEQVSSKESQEFEELKAKTVGMYRSHVRQVLGKLLEAEGLDQAKWLDFVDNLTKKVSATLNPYATMEEVDVRKFVKVKKYPGSEPSDSRFISGEVFTNTLVRVSSPICYESPKIVLIGGSVRAREHDDKVAPLTTVAYREKEYANAFCSRILALAPKVILVGGSVCRLVRQTLEDNDVEVLSCVKSRVLNRISRYFGLTIFREHSTAPGSSAEELVLEKIRVGKCGSISRMPYEDKVMGATREYVFVEGSDARLGCTLLLRGGDSWELSRVKKVVKDILPYQRNARFEPIFLLTCGANPIVQTDPLSNRELSMSPYVRLACREGPESSCSGNVTMQLDAPSSVTAMRKSMRPPSLVKVSVPKSDHVPSAKSEMQDVNSNLMNRNGLKKKELVRQNRCGVALRAFDDVVDRPHRETAIRPEQTMCFEEPVGSYVYILFSSYDKNSSAAPHHCIRPFPFKMQFYSDMDLALGRFLDNYVFCNEYRCPNHKICKTHMNTHIRTFCNGNSSVRMDVSWVDDSAFSSWQYEEKDIVVWKFCPTCRLITQVMPLKDEAYMYSFAMFLTMVMHDKKLGRRGSTSQSCQHLLSGDHLTCFAKKGTVASFQRGDIVCPQLLLPTYRISVPEPYVESEAMAEEVRLLSTHGKMVYNAIFDEIKRIMSCSVPILEETAGAYLEAHSKSHIDFRELMNTLNEFQQRSDYLQEARALVFKIRKHLCRSIFQWRQLVVALQEKSKKELDSRSRKESGSNRGDIASGSQSSVSLAGLNVETPSKARVEEALTPLPKNYEYIYKPPFSSTHHYCLSSWQNMLVDENQVSTIISYTLSSRKSCHS